MDWLNNFQKGVEKTPDYAEKTLAAYRLGMRAKGSIVGVRILVGVDCCAAARELPDGAMYLPEDAPHIPLPDCTLGASCRCVYRPVMTYEIDQND